MGKKTTLKRVVATDAIVAQEGADAVGGAWDVDHGGDARPLEVRTGFEKSPSSRGGPTFGRGG